LPQRSGAKSLDAHKAAQDAVDPDATDFSMAVDSINIGMSLNKLERYDEAIPYFLRARKLYQKEKSPLNVSHVDNHLAIAYISLENGEEAKFYAKHVYNYAKIAEDFTLEGYALFHLGRALVLTCEYEEAETKLKRALEMFTIEENKDWEDIIGANRSLAYVLTQLGRDEEAQERLEQLATIEETMLGESLRSRMALHRRCVSGAIKSSSGARSGLATGRTLSTAPKDVNQASKS